MFALMQKNIVLNRLSSKVSAVVYDWGTPAPEIISQLLEAKESNWHPDVILAADCVYFEPAFPLLLQTLGDLLGPETVCYFCFKKRRKADWRFIKQMQKQFDAKPVPYTGREEDQRESIYLFKVRRKALSSES
jgi:protein N-lysine methyltransferase METTL21A